MEAIARPGARFEFQSTLQLFVPMSAEIKPFYFATGSLNFSGIIWQPHLREAPEFVSSMLGEEESASVELQNVDTVLGRRFSNNTRIIEGARALVGRYWESLDDGRIWHKVFITGIVDDARDNEMVVRFTVFSDIYAPGVNVGATRDTRRKCQAPGYKLAACGSTSDLPTCPRTLEACADRHPNDDEFVRNMGAPFLPANVKIAIPQ
jgi:hypothetical protein